MPELPRVSQEFEADATKYIAGIEAMIAANQSFIDSINEAIAKVAELQAAIDHLDGKVITVTVKYVTEGAPDKLQQAAQVVQNVQGPSGDPFAGMEESAAKLDQELKAVKADAAALDQQLAAFGRANEPFAYTTADVDQLNAALKESGADSGVAQAALAALGSKASEAGSATRDVGTAMGAAGAAAGGAATLFGLSATAWHMIIMGAAEFAAVFIPAMVAFAAGAAVMIQGAQDIYTHVSAVYTSTEALGKAFNTTAGQVFGLGNALQQAQDQMQPQIYELFGAAINGAKNNMGQFVSQGKQVVGVLDEFAARIDVDLKNGMTQYNGLLALGVQDLTAFGQILGNVGHALVNFASDMPGIAEVLLRIINGISGFVLWLSKLPPMLITVVMGIEEAYRWSGALASIFGVLGKAISLVGTLGIPVFAQIGQNVGKMASSVITGISGMIGNLGKLGTTIGESLGKDMSGAEQTIAGFRNTLADFASFMTGPWGAAIGLGALALGAFIIWAVNAKSATQQWVDGLENSVSAAKGLSQIGTTYSALGAVTSALGSAQKQLTQNMQESQGAVVGVATRFGNYNEAAQAAHANTLTLQGSVGTLSQAQKQLTSDFGNEIGNVQYLASAYKINYVQAAELAGNAGVSLTTSLKGNSTEAQIARQQISNYVTGLTGMTAPMGTLGGDINAVTIATGLQNSKVGQLTQSWSTVMQLVQGPSNGFIALSQSLDQFNSDASTAGARMTGLGGATTTTTRNVTDASTKLQGDFNNTVNAMQGYTNSLTTAAAVTGNGGPLIQGIKDEIAILIPMAGSNQNAAAQIKVLWQEAGGSASDSMSKIATAVDGTKNPLQNLQNLTGKVALSLANLGQDAQNLAQTITQSLNQTLVDQANQLTGVSAKSAIYLQALQQYGPNSAQAQAALGNLNNATSQATQLASQAAAGVTALSGNTSTFGSDANSAATGGAAKLNQAIQDINNQGGIAAQTLTSQLINAVKTSGSTSSSASQTIESQLVTALENTGTNAQTAHDKVQNLITILNGLNGKTFTAVVQIQEQLVAGTASGTGSGNPLGGGLATGGRIPGYGGGDIVPALLEPGEAIVPKHLTSSVAPFLKAHGVPGFASGGVAGSAGDLTAAYAALDALYANHTMPQLQWDAAYDAAWNRINADKAAGGTTSSSTSSSSSYNYAWSNPPAPSNGAATPTGPWDSSGNLLSNWYDYYKGTLPWNTPQDLALQAQAASQNAAMLAAHFPNAPIPRPAAGPGQFLGEWLPSSMISAAPPAPVSTPSAASIGGTTTLEAAQPVHVHVKLDGRDVWYDQQKHTLKYNLRNNGIATGLQKPR